MLTAIATAVHHHDIFELHAPRSTRRKVVGVDMWFDAPDGPDVALAYARRAARGTHLRAVEINGLLNADDLWPPRARIRFLARDDDAHVTDAALAELLGELGERPHWNGMVKLEVIDGIPAFAPVLSDADPLVPAHLER